MLGWGLAHHAICPVLLLTCLCSVIFWGGQIHTGRWAGPSSATGRHHNNKRPRSGGAPAGGPGGEGPYDARQWEFYCDACRLTIEKGEVRCVFSIVFGGGLGASSCFGGLVVAWALGGKEKTRACVARVVVVPGRKGRLLLPHVCRATDPLPALIEPNDTTIQHQLRVPPLPRRILPLPPLLPRPIRQRCHPPAPLPAQHRPLPRHRPTAINAPTIWEWGKRGGGACGGNGCRINERA